MVFLTAATLAFGSCNRANQIPVMGDHTVYEVNMEELSGLSFNQDRTALLACGDKGTVKEVSFEGEILKHIWSKRSAPNLEITRPTKFTQAVKSSL